MESFLNTLLALLFTAAAVFVAAAFFWKREAVKIRAEKALKIRVDRLADGPSEWREEAETQGRLLRLLDVNPSATPALPSGLPALLTLGDYLFSLDPHGEVSWERVLVSVANKFGLTAALPLALFLPNRWRTEAAAGGLLSSFPSMATTTALTTAISTLDLAAFGESVHLYHAAVARKKQQQALQKRQKRIVQRRWHSIASKAAAAEAEAAASGAAEAAVAAGKQDGAPAADRIANVAEQAAEAQLHAARGPLELLRQGGNAACAQALATAAANAAAASGTVATAAEGNTDGPLLLTQATLPLLLGLSKEEMADDTPAPAAPPSPISPFLPDLYLGNGGLRMTHSKAKIAVCTLMAGVANRLMANALAGLEHTGAAATGGAGAGGGGAQQQSQQQQAAAAGHTQPFAVRLAEGGPPLESLEAFLEALVETGHDVKMVLASNLTSFGVGLSVRCPSSGSSSGSISRAASSAMGGGGSGSGSSAGGQEQEGGGGDDTACWQQVPISYPLRCAGLWALDEYGQPLDIITLISHASVRLTVRGPQLQFDLEWCLNVEGGTFWLPDVATNRYWATGEGCKVRHPLAPAATDGSSSDPANGSHPASGSMSSSGSSYGGEEVSAPGEMRRLARLLTAASCVNNLAGQSDRLLFGGYGHLGVCLDSVAAIQQAMCGRCTLFPLVLGGEAKMRLMHEYRQAAQPAVAVQAPGWQYAQEAAALQLALLELPYDITQEPCTAADASRRALACLPEGSPFLGVPKCRGMLQAALATAESLCPTVS